MLVSDFRPANLVLLFLVSGSFFGLALAVLFSVSPPVSQTDFMWRRPVVGSVFALVCVSGSVAVILPNKCSRGFSYGEERRRGWVSFAFKRGSTTSDGDSLVLRGHHPVCDVFSSHVFDLGGRRFCATCSGLLLGALVALGGVGLYFFGGYRVGQDAFGLLWVGVLGVIVGLLQSPLIRVQRSFVRVMSGALLAVGALLILVTVDELVGDFFLDIFLVFLSVLWLVTRISFSQWEHEKMCSACGSASCEIRRGMKK
jgi:hypothetical protein